MSLRPPEPGVLGQILVVEDDDAYRRMVARMLQNAGFRVMAADGFSAALELIAGNPEINLLLIDIGMPAGTPHGMSIGRAAQARREGLKVLYMTGAYDPNEFALYASEEMVLRKPFTQDELMTAVTNALSGRNSAAGAAQ